jgi:hypothetical protein
MVSKSELGFYLWNGAIIAGTVIGANIGVYRSMEWSNENKQKYGIIDFVGGSGFGAGLGAMIGVVSPILIPASIIGLPAYILNKKPKE